MIYLDLPTINGNGTPEQQLAEIRSYIYRNNEQINAALSNCTAEKMWETAAQALTSTSSGKQNDTSAQLNYYRNLRDLIIKTADCIVKTDEQWSMALNGSYLARSQFGDYLLNTSVEINGTSTGFTQLYNYSSQIGEDFTQLCDNYIKHGLLDNSGVTPIYGIEIGLCRNTITAKNPDTGIVTTVPVTNPCRTRITADRWSFLTGVSGNSETEVAYITGNAIHFPSAEISGGTIGIGSGNFQVNRNGILTAKGGDFSWDGASGGMKLTGSGFRFYEKVTENNLTVRQDSFALTPQRITFYHPNSEEFDTELAHIKRGIRRDGAESGLEIDLRSNCDFFSILRSIQNSAPARYITIIPSGSNTDIESTPGIYFHQPSDFKHTVRFNSAVTFNGTVDFDNNNVKKLNVVDSLKSDGHAGVSGTCVVLCQGNGGDYYATLTIRNGIITGLGGLQSL